MGEHSRTEKIGGVSINFCGHPSRAENRYDKFIYLTLHLEISVVNYSRSKGQIHKDWVLVYNLLVYHLVSKKTKKKGI